MRSFVAGIAVLACAGTAAAAAAQDAPAVPARSTIEAPAAFDGAALADDALSHVAGRQGADQLAQANETSTVSNNSVNGQSVTGAVQIDGSAFQNLQGLSVINANTGNNVAINSAMNVNIAIAPQN